MILYYMFILGMCIILVICFVGGGWVSRLVSLGLRSLIGLVGLSVGSVGLCICIFVCWWGLVFGYTSCFCVLGLVRYILLRLLRVRLSFLFGF